MRVPGDKSVSHRALMLAALASGRSSIRGILRSADIRSTAGVLGSMGVFVPSIDSDELVIDGVGLQGLKGNGLTLDCGNSGTTARLISGVISGSAVSGTLVGDASLSARPMKRVSQPLIAMGADIELSPAGGLPMRIQGGSLRGLTWYPDVASAQVKSAILLAGLVARVPVEIHEVLPTRDHTERMMRSCGVDIRVESGVVSLVPADSIGPVVIDVPGDPSSAAFLIGFAAVGGARRVSVENVGVNPGRIGAFNALRRMGARIEFTNISDSAGEPVATVIAESSELGSVSIGGEEVPSLIDELPLIACLAARGAGELTVSGATELRVKESDRITAVVSNLVALGVDAHERPDGFVVRGSQKSLRGRVVTYGDHRIAMAFGVLAALSGNEIEIDDPDCVGVSYPDFWNDIARLRIG